MVFGHCPGLSIRNELTACSVDRDGFASGLALVIHASLRRTSDLSILSFMLSELLELNVPNNIISL